jgi:hypothetical protein
MKTRSILSILAVALVFAWAGCSKNAPEHQEAASQMHGDAHAGQTDASQTTTPDESQAATGGAEVSLAGTLGCGHCNYHVATECAAAIKTASGDVYLIDNADKDSELFQKRYDGIQVTVNGNVSETDDVNHITMTSYKVQ